MYGGHVSSLPRRHVRWVAEVWSVGGLKTVMASCLLQQSDQCPYESGSFMISSSMSFSSCCSVKRCISLPDLCVVSKCWLLSRTLSTCTCFSCQLLFDQTSPLTCKCTHDWRVELIQVLPFGLAGRHHVDFGVFEGATVPYFGHDLLRVGAERAVLANEQGVTQTPLLSEDG